MCWKREVDIGICILNLLSEVTILPSLAATRSDDIGICIRNILPEVTALPSLVTTNYNVFLLSGDLMFVLWSEGHVTFKGGSLSW